MAATPHILIIEDEERIRATMQLALETEGYSVATAADGPEGLGRFREDGPWNVVLLDQRMPGMDGTEVLRRLKQVDPAVRIIVVTAYGSVELASKALGTGASAFLLKPINPDQLRKTVRDVLEWK